MKNPAGSGKNLPVLLDSREQGAEVRACMRPNKHKK